MIGWDILLLLGLVLEDVVTAGTIAKSAGSKPPVESSVESGSGVTALSSSVGKSKTRLDKPTGADSIVMTNLECSTWGLLAMNLSYHDLVSTKRTTKQSVHYH